MNPKTKIPFGLDPSAGELVDVFDVPRGAACGCICPGCELPMIARKGDHNEWHFAHAGHVEEKPQEPCQYSFFVSVRHMVHQLLPDLSSIATPALFGEVNMRGFNFGSTLRESYEVTQARRMAIKAVEVETRFKTSPVDAIVHGDEFPFVLYITHPDRQLPLELKRPDHKEFGVLAMDLKIIRQRFQENWAAGERQAYSEILRSQLEVVAQGKTWEYHPNEPDERKSAELRAQERLDDDKRRFDERLSAHASRPASVQVPVDTPTTADPKAPSAQNDQLPREFGPIQNSRTPIKQKAVEQQAESMGLGRYRCHKCIRTWAGMSRVCGKCGSVDDVEQVPF